VQETEGKNFCRLKKMVFWGGMIKRDKPSRANKRGGNLEILPMEGSLGKKPGSLAQVKRTSLSHRKYPASSKEKGKSKPARGERMET